MVGLTRPSDYGPLTLRESDSKRPEIELPKMQFSDGDLIIKLGLKSEEWLVIHSAVLREASPYFHASFSDQWEQGDSKPEMIFNPALGKDVPMRCRVLRFVEDTYLLEREDTLMELEEDATPFPRSKLALPGWPEVWPDYNSSAGYSEEDTKRALHAFFALLYGAQIDCQQICGRHDKGATDFCRETLSMAVIICAYAEYWGRLDLIGPRAFTVLQSVPGFWGTGVSSWPNMFLAFAIKLENADLYSCALRHSIRESYKEWGPTAEIAGLDVAHLRAFYEPHLKQQDKEVRSKLDALVEDLRKLQLQPVRAKHFGGGWHDAKTRFLDILPHKDQDRPEHTKAFEPVDYLARSIYSEYVLYRLEGEQLVDTSFEGDLRTQRAGNRLELIHDIEQAADTQDPSHLFDAAASVRFATMFNFSPQQKHQLHLRLKFLVREANDLIKAAFPVKTFQEMYGGKLTKCVLARAYLGSCYTYMAVPDRVPWSKRQTSASSHKDKAIVPGIGVADASPEWIATLGERFGGDVEEIEETFAAMGLEEIGFEGGAGAEVDSVDW